jgi:hypothetical protein
MKTDRMEKGESLSVLALRHYSHERKHLRRPLRR